MKQKVIIFGTGSGAVKAYDLLKDTYDIMAFAGNDPKIKEGMELCGKPAIMPSEIAGKQFDLIVIGSQAYSEIYSQLTEELKIPPEKIHKDIASDSSGIKLDILKDIAGKISNKKVEGQVAELGVYRGDFSRHINRLFPDRTLHLFDTFTGFDERDVSKEKEMDFSGRKSLPGYDPLRAGYFGDTDVEMVLSKMEYPNKCRIHKGYFPETSHGIDKSAKFCFVCIDVDLYQPLLAGLRYFYDKLVPGGAILILDVYHEYFVGLKHALEEFLHEHPDTKYETMGNGASVAIWLE